MQAADDYPELAELIHAWFHQDFDLDGDSVGGVMAAYRTVTPPEQQALVRKDIARFLAAHAAHELDASFEQAFHPDIIPSALSGSTQAFLEQLRDSLLGS